MKKSITITLTMILLCTATLLAQSGRAPKQSEQRPPDLRGIDLTDDQKASLKTIHDNTEQQVQAVRNNGTLSDAEKHEQIEALHNNARQQSQGVLTPEQQQALGNRQGENQRGNQGGPRIPNLTDEQKGQLQTIHQQEREQIDAVRNNSTLSDAEKRSQIDTIRQNSREQSQGVLTPEQRQAAGNRNGSGQPGEMGGERGGPQGGRGPQSGQQGGQPNIGGGQGQPGGGGRMGGPGGFGGPGGPGGGGGGQRPGGGGPRGGRP